MKADSKTVAIAAAAAIVLSGAAAAASTRDAGGDAQHVRADIAQARAELAHRQRWTAMNTTGDAETALLNAKQSGAYANPEALAALERAHDDLRNRRLQQAASELLTAQNGLTAHA